MIKIGNASAFWGDSPYAPADLLREQPDLDYLTLDYLAEVSLSIMAIQKEKDPKAGFARDFVDALATLIPFWEKGAHCKVITNAGGLNPKECAALCRNLLQGVKKVAVVEGDDVLAYVKKNAHSLCHLDTKEPLGPHVHSLTSANVYLGAEGIRQALSQGADIVITGRVADPSLTVAPCLFHFNWDKEDFDKIAAATVAGHLIECGTQVTGGFSTNWMDLEDPVSIGFPVVEMEADGTFVITKPERTGGKVSLETVKEQLLYEIRDPSCYLSPDATVSFTGLVLKEIGKDRVEVRGAKGSAPPSTYKVSVSYKDGYRSETMLAVFGHEARAKAKKAGVVLLERLKLRGVTFQKSKIECIGGDTECVLRVAVSDSSYANLEAFAREVASLITSGPQGLTGYGAGRPHIFPVFPFFPCLINHPQPTHNYTQIS